ncbi:MAG: hypothetical protein V5A55_04440 [Halovenus sp.]
MRENNVLTSDDECTTTESFTDHDITDGSQLVQRTYYRLAAAEITEYEPTESFFDALESAFIWAYLGTVEENGIPEHVEAAIDDARALTAEEFEDRPDADLRTEVVQTFYAHVSSFHCAYRQ